VVILVLVVAAIVLGVGIAFLVSYSTKEISDTLGMPAVTVRSHLHRARRHLKKILVLHGDAPFYILDEPFTQVDPVNIDEVKALIRERSKDHGIIVTDHNYDAISSVADNLFVIADGYTSPVRCREDLVRHGYLRA